MKKLIEKIFGAKVYAKHSAIKGTKSGGNRDTNGKDWRKTNAEGGTN
jgi:hypothetical protein